MAKVDIQDNPEFLVILVNQVIAVNLDLVDTAEFPAIRVNLVLVAIVVNPDSVAIVVHPVIQDTLEFQVNLVIRVNPATVDQVVILVNPVFLVTQVWVSRGTPVYPGILSRTNLEVTLLGNQSQIP